MYTVAVQRKLKKKKNPLVRNVICCLYTRIDIDACLSDSDVTTTGFFFVLFE